MDEPNPKILHRIYFDTFAPFYDPFEHYLETWAREMPGYKIMKWNASNLDVQENAWTRRAAKEKAPVFLSEYFRWKVLAEHGGIYLDADCEVLNGAVLHRLQEELHAADSYDTFFGVEERSNGHPTAQTVAAKKGSPLVAFMKSLYEKNLSELWAWREKRGLIGPQLMALYFLDRGFNVRDDGFFKNLDEPVVIDRCKVYPQAYFSPKFSLLGDLIDYQVERTCVYHLFANSNVDFSSKRRHEAARQKALTFAEYSEAIAAAQRFPRRFDASWLSTVVGEQSDSGIQVSGRDGVVAHGPYISLPEGRYVARVHGDFSARSGAIDFAVTANQGELTLCRRRLSLPLADHESLESAEFSTDGRLSQLEVVVSTVSVDKLRIESVEFDLATPPRLSIKAQGNSLKILHRIYFGFDGKPDQFQTYLKTWQEQLPDYKIMMWNASNLPMDINEYSRRLYAERDHTFLTDFFRWYVLREHGGIYLDADVEVVNGPLFNELVTELESSPHHEAFIGIDERSGGWYTAHSMASRPQSDLARFMCELYENFGHFAAWRKKGLYFWAPQLVALYFANRGHNPDGMGTTPKLTSPTIVSGVKIYPQEWFSPLAPSPDSNEPFTLNSLTETTCLCHHFACSWHDENSKYLQYSKSLGGQANVLLREIAARLGGERIFPAPQLSTSAGRKDDGRIRTTGQSGYLAYGPYIALAPGRHKVTFSIEDADDVSGATVDVVANIGDAVLLAPRPLSISFDGKCSIEFATTNPENAVEFRIHVDSRAMFSLSQIALERV